MTEVAKQESASTRSVTSDNTACAFEDYDLELRIRPLEIRIMISLMCSRIQFYELFSQT